MSLNTTQDQNSSLPALKLSENKGFYGKLAGLDVFAFIPVPVFAPGKSSSKRSLCFSFFLFFGMIAYVLMTLYGFVWNNVPRTSQQQATIDDKTFKMPNVALTMIPDMNYGISVVDKSIYEIKISQGTLYKGLEKTREEKVFAVNYACNPEWLPQMNFTNFICPAELGILEGNLFTSEAFKFIKIDVLICNETLTPTAGCKPLAEIEKLLVGARFYLFIEQDKTFYKTEVNAFKALFYYAVPSLFQRYEIYLQSQQVKTSADYFRSFTEQTKQALFYNKEKTYISTIIPGAASNNLITIWLRLNEEETQQKQQPTSLTDVFGKWGALWSVLITTFGLYFLKHNKQKFYKKNPEWENFGSFVNRKKTQVSLSLELPDLKQ